MTRDSHLRRKSVRPQNPTFKGGITAMNLRRKIAAALAAVMAFGSVGIMDLGARTYSVGTTPQGIEGEWIGHGATHRLTDIHAGVTGPFTGHGVDFVVSGSQLEHGTGQMLEIRLRITGDGIWNYGRPGIEPNADRRTDTAVTSTDPNHWSNAAQANLGPSPNRPLVTDAPGANWGTTAAVWNAVFFNPAGQLLPGGGGGNMNATFWLNDLETSAGVGVPAGYTMVWAGDTNRAYIVDANRVAHWYAIWVPTGTGVGGGEFQGWHPVTAAADWVAGLPATFHITPGVSGNTAAALATWHGMIFADAGVPVAPADAVIFPTSDRTAVVMSLPANQQTGRILPVGAVTLTPSFATTHVFQSFTDTGVFALPTPPANVLPAMTNSPARGAVPTVATNTIANLGAVSGTPTLFPVREIFIPEIGGTFEQTENGSLALAAPSLSATNAAQRLVTAWELGGSWASPTAVGQGFIYNAGLSVYDPESGPVAIQHEWTTATGTGLNVPATGSILQPPTADPAFVAAFNSLGTLPTGVVLVPFHVGLPGALDSWFLVPMSVQGTTAPQYVTIDTTPVGTAAVTAATPPALIAGFGNTWFEGLGGAFGDPDAGHEFPTAVASQASLGNYSWQRVGAQYWRGQTIDAALGGVTVTVPGGNTALAWGTSANDAQRLGSGNIPMEGAGTPDQDTRIISPLTSVGNDGVIGSRLNHIAFTGRVNPNPQHRNEIPFTLTFEHANEMVIRWQRADVDRYGAASSVLRVPMLVQATGNGEIAVEVMSATISPALIGGARQVITGAGIGGQLTIPGGGIGVGMSTALISDLRITEVGYGFRAGEVRAFTLTLPYDYVWVRNVGSAATNMRVHGSGRAGAFNNVDWGTNFTTEMRGMVASRWAGPENSAPFMFISQHPDTGVSRLHVVMNGATFPTGQGVGQITFHNLMVGHRNPINPVWAEDLSITLANGYGGGFRSETAGSIHTTAGGTYNALWNVIAPASVVAFSLVNQGLTLRPTDNAAGEMQDVIAGRTYRNLQANNPNMMPTAVDSFAGVARRIRVEETVPGSALNRDLVFTLTDAEGEALDTAKIAAVQFNSGVLGVAGQAGLFAGFGDNVLFHNAVPEANAVHRIIAGAGDLTNPAAINVMFSEDGRTVTVRGLRANDILHRRVWLEATFFLSTDVNSDDNVYVTLTQVGPGIGGFDADFVYPNATLQLADVRQVLEIESEMTNIPHRAQSIDVADIVITELEAGALVRDRRIELAISEFGVPSTRTELGFNPIVAGDVTASGTLNVAMMPTTLGQSIIRTNVTSASNAAATLTFSNLDLFVNQAIPVGSYGVVARGSAILDNDNSEINARAGVANNPNNPGFRRYGFGGLLFEPFANVTMPGAYGTGGGAIVDPQVAQVTARQNSNIVEIDGRTVQMMTEDGRATPMRNVNDFNFFPLRGIAQVFGAEHNISWAWVMADGSLSTSTWSATQQVNLVLGGRTIIFTTGSSTFTVNGVAYTMPAGQMPHNHEGTIFVSFAALGHALGVHVSYEGHGAAQQFFFNQPDRGNVVTLEGAGGAAPATEPVVTNEELYNYYLNNNGNNGNGNGEEEEEEAA